MDEVGQSSLVVVIGDIHGRFHRVREWIAALESARGHDAALVLAVGDIEAFLTADDHRRKAAKRAMPAEFADYVSGRCAFERPLHFIGGNNEDFEALHEIPAGGDVARNLHYLGRVGHRRIEHFNVAWLSGIYAPRYVDKTLQPPTTPDACRQAGYFRHDEVRSLDAVDAADILLTHEWPRGLAIRPAPPRHPGRDLRAYQTPWIGNQVARSLVERIRPGWMFCGHSHVPFATALRHEDGRLTRIACLDQASRSDGAVFWTEWKGGQAVLAGWGTSGEPCWREGQPWDERRTPSAGFVTRASAPRRAEPTHRAERSAEPARSAEPRAEGARTETTGVHPATGGEASEGAFVAGVSAGDGAPLPPTGRAAGGSR
jgi:lariat debranching enzyme